ncbi:MAG: LysR family transcriptional regulator [Burkholderiaceae bacterium]|nr:LysR family transcriptional regulator [Burkholderiaceae bacterium]
MDLTSLAIFIAAVEEKSFSKAAEREDRVISAVSKRIAELEKNLDKILLYRHNRGVEPTPAGTLLYQRAKAILRSVELTEVAISSFSSEGQMKIRLAANPSSILQFLPSLMGRFLKNRSELSIDLLEANSFDIPRLTSDGTVDIGLYHANRPAPGVHSIPFTQDRVGLVVPIGHPLAHREALYLEEALDYDFLGYFPQHSLDRFLAYVGESISRPPNVKLQVSNFETRCSMIREGLGIGIVPEQIAQNYLQSMGLVLLRLNDDWAQRDFYLCLRDAKHSRPVTGELLNFIKDNFDKSSADKKAS